MPESAAYRSAFEFLMARPDLERGTAAAELGLETAWQLLEALGNPQLAYPTVLVAGTNGKGSVVAMLELALRSAGYRTGLYTQPHLHHYRERARLDGIPISEEAFVSAFDAVRAALPEVEGSERLTTFELTTALVFQAFHQAHIDVGVIEVGLGGRLDTTNLTQPLVAVIAPIDLDHTQILGNTIEQIALEKAGIIKGGELVISAPQRPEALAVLEQAAREKSSQLLLIGRDVLYVPLAATSWGGQVRIGGKTYQVGLLGRHQLVNAALAVTALGALGERGMHIPHQAVGRGTAQARWPGRLETIPDQPLIVLDGAHNPHGARALAAALDLWSQRPKVLVLGAGHDKDLANMVLALRPACDHLVATQSRHPRAAPAPDVAQALGAPTFSDLPAALEEAKTLAGANGLVCIAGSLFLVAEARELLGLDTSGCL